MSTPVDATPRPAYELPVSEASPSAPAASDAAAPWREALLIGNVLWFLRLRCGARVSDPTSGYRAADRDAIRPQFSEILGFVRDGLTRAILAISSG